MNRIEEAQLRSGDVLLSSGDSDVSCGIRELDGGSYSHAALWTGSDVIESTLPQVRRVPVSVCAEHAFTIDVYRHHGIGEAGDTVVAKALECDALPYATLDLAWCTAIVAVSSWLPGDWSEMNALYGAGQVDRMLRLLRKSGQLKGERVTCVELIGRSYFRAQRPIRVHLKGGRSFSGRSFYLAVRDIAARVRTQRAAGAPHHGPFEALDDDFESELAWLEQLQETGRAGSTQDVDALEQMRSWQRDVLLEGQPLSPAFELHPEEIAAKHLIVGSDWAAALLTPRLLEHSPDLHCVGRLHQR